MPYTDEIVYPPLIQAATGILTENNPPTPLHLLLPLLPLLPSNLIKLYNLKLAKVPVVSEPLPDTPSETLNCTFEFTGRLSSISLTIFNTTTFASEFSIAQACKPSTYHPFEDYLAKMSSPYKYTGQPEITAVSALYGNEMHAHFDNCTLPPAFATADDVYPRYTEISRHYDTFELPLPTPPPPPSFRQWPILCVMRRHQPTAGGLASTSSRPFFLFCLYVLCLSPRTFQFYLQAFSCQHFPA